MAKRGEAKTCYILNYGLRNMCRHFPQDLIGAVYNFEVSLLVVEYRHKLKRAKLTYHRFEDIRDYKKVWKALSWWRRLYLFFLVGSPQDDLCYSEFDRLLKKDPVKALSIYLKGTLELGVIRKEKLSEIFEIEELLHGETAEHEKRKIEYLGDSEEYLARKAAHYL